MGNNAMNAALVLEGGGMRGIYTTGVLDAFLDRGLYFDAIIGVSAGASHALFVHFPAAGPRAPSERGLLQAKRLYGASLPFPRRFPFWHGPSLQENSLSLRFVRF